MSFDYRGFGDSSDMEPTESGALMDARCVVDFFTTNNGFLLLEMTGNHEKKIHPPKILIVGFIL